MRKTSIKKEESLRLMKLGFTGAVGRTFLIRDTPWGKVLSRFPKRPRKRPTDKQLHARQNFRSAIAKAKDMLADRDIATRYQNSMSPGDNIFNRIVSDCLKLATSPPSKAKSGLS